MCRHDRSVRYPACRVSGMMQIFYILRIKSSKHAVNGEYPIYRAFEE